MGGYCEGLAWAKNTELTGFNPSNDSLVRVVQKGTDAKI